jgi:hypothetical protein
MLVECCFATLTEHQLPRHAHRSSPEWEAAHQRYLTVQNQVGKPLLWHKAANTTQNLVAILSATKSANLQC